MVKQVDNQTSFVKNWDFYRLKNKKPNVNFYQKAVFFIGIEESGCPTKIKNIKLSIDRTTMKVSLSRPKKECAALASPRTFVFEIDKESANEIKNVVINKNNVKTSVPIE